MKIMTRYHPTIDIICVKTYIIIFVNSINKRVNRTAQYFIGMKKTKMLYFQGDYIVP